MALDKLYTVEETAQALRLSVRTVYQWVYDGKLKASKVGSKWLITEAEIKKVITEGA